MNSEECVSTVRKIAKHAFFKLRPDWANALVMCANMAQRTIDTGVNDLRVDGARLWSEVEDDELRYEHDMRKSIDKIARDHNRSEAQIKDRLRNLKLIK